MMARPKRPSETFRRVPPGLTPDQAAALAALSGENLYATVAGCRVVKVEGENPVPVAALKGLAALGLVEVVMLPVYMKRET